MAQQALPGNGGSRWRLIVEFPVRLAMFAASVGP
jgi:hypothetical protein